MVNQARRPEYNLESITVKYHQEIDVRIKERLLAIKLSYQGKSVEEIADILDRTRQTVSQWITDFNYEGLSGLKSKEISGRPKKIVNEVEEEIKKK